MDGVEIWEPYIKEYQLHNLYNKIYNTNILDFKFDHYNFIILGDILEHLSREDASSLIEYLCARCDEILVVVPYNLPQDVVNNNIPVGAQIAPASDRPSSGVASQTADAADAAAQFRSRRRHQDAARSW